MRHEELTERVAGRLETVAAIEGEDRRMGRGVARACANEMQAAARMVREMAQVVTRAENGPSGEPGVETRLSKLGNNASLLSTLRT
jgi:hypothetical protein